MKKALILDTILNDSIEIHGPILLSYFNERLKKLSEIFIIENNVINEVKAPWIRWKIDKRTPSYAYLYILYPSKEDLSIFCEEILKIHIFLDKKIPLVFTNNLFFSLKAKPSMTFEFKEICLRIDREEDLYSLEKNKDKITQDLYSGLCFPEYINELLKIKRSQVNLNTPILYEVINKLLIKFPSKIDKQIFTDLQQFLIFAADSFTKQHSLNYVFKIILSYYFFKKEIERKSKAYPELKHIKLKLFKTKRYFPFGNKDVLGIFIALNLEQDTERFGKKHLVIILEQVFFNYAVIENSFFSFQIGSSNFIYIELKKKEGFESQKLIGLIQTLKYEIKNSIETISSRIISYRNEEEIYRNIILLKDQLQQIFDLPQVVISFHEHNVGILKFYAIVLKLVEKNKIRAPKKMLKISKDVSLHIEKKIILEPLNENLMKEASVIRLSFSSSQFIRKDHSIDLLKARNHASSCITELVGEFRDFNGGYIDQQRKNFYQIKQMLKDLNFQNELYIENLFYSLVPVTVQASFSAKHLKKLFSFFIEILPIKIPPNENILCLEDENNETVCIFIKSKDVDLKGAFFPSIEESFFDPLKFASTYIEIDGYLYLGFIFLYPEDPKGFIQEIHKITKSYFSSKKIEQSLCINLPRSEYSLDPRLDSDRHSGVLIKMLYEGLTRIGTNNKPMLALAKRIEISEDKKTYIFHLKETRWSNGLLVTAYDFEYAWKKFIDPNFNTSYVFMFYSIKNAEAIKSSKKDISKLGVKSINEKTLKVELEYPMPYFLSLTAHWCYSPLCKKICQKDPGWAYFGENEYVCNGPFSIDTWNYNKEIILTKNYNYWDASSVMLKQIRALNIEDEDILLSMFNNDKIHWLGEPLSLIPSKALNEPNYQKNIQSYRTDGIFWLMLNVKCYPIKSKYIRQALAYSLDRKRIIKHTLANKASVATQIAKNFEFFTNNNTFNDADIEKARQLFKLGLQEMGLDEKNYPTLTLIFSPSEQHEKLFYEIIRQWRDVLGIKVILKRVSTSQLRENRKNNDFQISGYTQYAWVDDPIYHFELLKRPGYGFNGTQWNNPLFLSLIEKAQKEVHPLEREKIIIQAQNIVLEEMPIIPIYFYNYRFMQSKSLKNVILSNVGQIDFKYSELK
jgi:oligopeptide transport system substrate-binding protein